MTEQEAIKQLKIQRTFTNGSNAKVEAIDIAIKALEMISKRDELEDFNHLENYIAEWNKYKVFHSDEPTEELHWMHELIHYYMVQFKLYRDSKLSPKEVLDMKVTYEKYRALGLTPELIEAMQGHNIAMINDLAEHQALGTVEELQQAINFKKYFMELYNEGLEVANWHENRDLEPLVNFIDAACNE